MLFRWRWIFPSRWLLNARPHVDTAAVRTLPAALFTLVFPDDCRVCGNPLEEISRIPVCSTCLSAPEPFVAEYFCSQCHAPFANASPLDEEGRCALCRVGASGFDRAYAYGEYGGTLRKLIHLFKYDGMKPLATRLGAMLASALPRDEAYDAIVPVPLHWWRRWNRGFNQADLLAQFLSKRLNAPVVHALTRRKSTQPQAGLTNASRRANVAHAFRAREGAVRDLRVLLVDDVLTTGATVAAAAHVLKRAGARRVTVLAVARADRRQVIAMSGDRQGSFENGQFGSIA